MVFDTVLLGGLVYRSGAFEKTNVYILNGKFTRLSAELLAARTVIDCKGFKILPGLIDPHVHFALDLGNVTSCDDFHTGSRAAAFGGVTSIIDFLDPIDRLCDLAPALEKRLADVNARGCAVDYGFHATLGNYAGNTADLADEVQQMGLFGVKVFTTYSESGRMISENQLQALLDQDLLTLVHAERDEMVDPMWQDMSSFEQSRPLKAELAALDWLVAHLGRGRLYVVHVSSGSGVLRLSGHDRIAIETCPHYLCFDRSVYSRPDGARYLMSPPLRDQKEMELLKQNIGLVDTLATDHCPFVLKDKMKSDDVARLPKGIGGISYSFLLMHGLFGDQIIDKMSANVADIFDLRGKGRIAPGNDADLMLFDPAAETVVETGCSGQSACDYSPYEGMTLRGRIIGTMCRGRWIMHQGEYFDTQGVFLRRGGP